MRDVRTRREVLPRLRDGLVSSLPDVVPPSRRPGDQSGPVNACCRPGSAGVRLYAEGPRCPVHTPATRAGKPEPDAARYCAPLRCYCGRCPGWTADTSYYVGETVLDIRAVASGRRRSSLAQYRSAQANSRGGAA